MQYFRRDPMSIVEPDLLASLDGEIEGSFDGSYGNDRTFSGWLRPASPRNSRAKVLRRGEVDLWVAIQRRGDGLPPHGRYIAIRRDRGLA